MIEDVLITESLAWWRMELSQFHSPPLACNNSLLSPPDDVGSSFLFTLLEQKRTGVGAISNPDSHNPGRKRDFCIEEKDVF
jgi:hypothetical protein